MADVRDQLTPGACEIAVHGYFEIEFQGFARRAPQFGRQRRQERAARHAHRHMVTLGANANLTPSGRIRDEEGPGRGERGTSSALQMPLSRQGPFDQVEVLDTARVDIDIEAVLEARQAASA